MPTVVTGTQALISAATGWLMGIIPAGGGLMAGYHWFMSGPGAGGDEMLASQHKRATRTTLIATLLAFCAVGLVKTLLSYY